MTIPCITVTVTAPTPLIPVYPDVGFAGVEGPLDAFRTVLIAGTGDTNVSITDYIVILDESLTGVELSSVARTLAPEETLASTVNVLTVINSLLAQGLISRGVEYRIHQRIVGWFGTHETERTRVTLQ